MSKSKTIATRSKIKKIRTDYQLIENDIGTLQIGDLLRFPSGQIRSVSRITDREIVTNKGSFGIEFVKSSCAIVPEGVDLVEYQNRMQCVWQGLLSNKSVVLKGFIIENEEVMI